MECTNEQCALLNMLEEFRHQLTECVGLGEFPGPVEQPEMGGDHHQGQ